MLTEVETIDDGITLGFQLMTSRLPTLHEQLLVKQAYDAFLAKYTLDIASAQSLLEVGEQPREHDLDFAQHAAMTMTASLIINLDETITKE